MSVIVGLPVDARPVVRSQVRTLVRSAGWDLRLPPTSALGHLRQPADRDALQDWLLLQARDARGFVLSLDMLVYGGLVPSRFIDDPLPGLLRRLEGVRALRRSGAGCPILAFAATMRISNNNEAQEEKPYWADHGTQLWSWSYHTDRARVLGAEDSRALARAAEATLPQAVRDDYLRTRQRNLQVTRAALALVREGVIDELVLPQDDTAEFGFNIAERRALQAEVEASGLAQRVSIRPGADEVMHTACARLVSRLEGRRPLRVAVAPSDPGHLPHLVARYEDRPLVQAVTRQIEAVGAVPCPDLPAADLLLAVHSQGRAQGDWALQEPLPERVGVDAAWFDTLAAWRTSGRPLALADLAYANGADPWLLAQPWPDATAYAGWNTASNTLGSVLAQSVLALGHEGEAPAREALALRLLEDGLYQADLRQVLRRSVDEASMSPEALEERARALVIPAAQAWAARRGLGWRVANLRLPWGRTFEVDLQLEPAT